MSRWHVASKKPTQDRRAYTRGRLLNPIVLPDNKSMAWWRPIRLSPRSTVPLVSDNLRSECCALGCSARICKLSARRRPIRTGSSSPLRARNKARYRSSSWSNSSRPIDSAPDPSRRSAQFPARTVSRHTGTSCWRTSSCPRTKLLPYKTSSVYTGYCRRSIPIDCSRGNSSGPVDRSLRNAIVSGTRWNISWRWIVREICSWGSSVVSEGLGSSCRGRFFDFLVPCFVLPGGRDLRRWASRLDARLCLS